MIPKAFITIVVIGITLATGAFIMKNMPSEPPQSTDETKRPPTQTNDVAEIPYSKSAGPVAIGGPFLLKDHLGKARSSIDFRGRYMLVYFGYTYCPDICPMALYALSEALDTMGDGAKKFQPLFITIDPTRDTQAVLGGYLKHFHPSIIALTGSQEEIDKARSAYHVHASKPLDQEKKEDYILDHSSIIYVMDPRGRFVTSFNHATPADHIAKVLLTLP